jgi:SAM-dependent methyltransferase
MAEEMQATRPSGQDAASAAANADYFAGERHGRHATEIDSYRHIREALDREIDGIGTMLDVGNGGVFEYNTSRVGSIVAVDLFLDELPDDHFPPNVTARRGDALDMQEPSDHYDAVLQAMLYHHLVGRGPDEMVQNVRAAIAGAARTVRPGGLLIVAEPCVPRWFYAVERVAFGAMKLLAKTPLLKGHPATIQLTPERVEALIGERFELERSYRIPRGRWTTLFGRVIPAAPLPSRMRMFVARRSAEAPGPA